MSAEDSFRYVTGWSDVSKKLAFNQIKNLNMDRTSYETIHKAIFDRQKLRLYYDVLWHFRTSGDDAENWFGQSATLALPGICGILMEESKRHFSWIYSKPISNQPERELLLKREQFFKGLGFLLRCDQFEIAKLLVADMAQNEQEFKADKNEYGCFHARQIELVSEGSIPKAEYLPNFYATVITLIPSVCLRLAIYNSERLPDLIRERLWNGLDLTNWRREASGVRNPKSFPLI